MDSEILEQEVPDAEEMADRTGEDEEMEERVGEGPPGREGIDGGPGDIEDALGDEPVDGGGLETVHERFEGHENAQPHDDETDRLEVAVFPQSPETDDGTNDGGEPDKGEEPPTPEPRLSQGDEGDGGVAAGDVPIDGSMVPSAQHLPGTAVLGQAMIEGGGDIGCQHPQQIERHPDRGPGVCTAHTPDEKGPSDDEGEENARSVAPRIEAVLGRRVVNHAEICWFLGAKV